MQRRQFMTASLAASALALAGEGSAQSAAQSAREFYQIRRYNMVSGPQTKLTENYFSSALIPALGRMGMGPVGTLRLGYGEQTPAYFLIIPVPSVQPLVTIDLKLTED